MKNVTALCFSALSLVSCARSYGRISFSWSLADSAGNALSCLSGEQVEIQAGSYIADFPCSDLHGTTDEILSGRYAVHFSLLDSTNAVESTGTQSLVVPDADIVTADPIIFTVTAPVGDLKLKWTLEDSNGAQLSCLSTETVQFVIDGLDPIDGSPFDCSLGQVTVTGIPVGTYTGGSATLLNNGSPEPTQGGAPEPFPIGQVVVTDGGAFEVDAVFAGLGD